MDLMDELRGIGWYLNEVGLKKVTPPPPNSNDVNEIIKLCLDTDFREIAEGALAAKKGPIVLQIQSIRNIAAPKISERSHGPRLLCVELSDGQTTIRALELQKVPSLDLNTPPGTKLRFRAEQLQLLGGYMLLKQAEVQILGGHVAHLVEKWEVARTMQMYARSGRRPSGAMGPPPWLAFGKNLNEVSENSGLGKERNFKSLQVATEKDKDNKDNEEFNAMRKQVIAEAAKAGTKKVFGGGGQQILDHNIKKILDKGYSEEEARQFLRATNNNLERALFNLKRRQESNKQYADSGPKSNNITTRATTSNREGGSSKRGGSNKADEAASTKPAANVSLFDFLTDKLPANTQRPSAVDTKPTNRNLTQTANEIKTNNTSSNNSQSLTKDSNPRNQQQQYERQTDTRGGRNSEPRQQQTGRTNRNDDNRRNERNERNVGGNNLNANSTSNSYNKQNGRVSSGGGAGGNRNNYDNNEDNSRRSARNDRNERVGGGVGGNRKTLNSNNNYQQQQQQQQQNNNESISNQISRSSEPRQRNHDNQQHTKTNSNRNQQQQRHNQQQPQQQQQHQQQHNVVGNTATVNNISNKQTHNNQRRPQSSTKQSTVNVNMNYNMNAPPPNHHHHHHSNNYPNPAPTQVATVATTAPTLLPNGFVYDPSKIIGFQSKEANEYAMNLLRSQGKTIAVDPNQTQTQTLPPPPPQQVAQQQLGPPQPQPPPIQYLAQPGPVPMTAIAASIQIPVAKPMPPMPHHYAMAGHSMPPQSNDGWSWKVGDLCMAKYWDDGQVKSNTFLYPGIQYYEAEITGISDKTCVVYFINYGNHEEVLKADCLPITDAHHRPINNYNLQQQMQPSPQQHQRAPMRYYVPPHKRNN